MASESIKCPHCECKVLVSEVEKEDGLCPECGQLVIASNLFDDYDDEDLELDEMDEEEEDFDDDDFDEDFEDDDELKTTEDEEDEDKPRRYNHKKKRFKDD